MCVYVCVCACVSPLQLSKTCLAITGLTFNHAAKGRFFCVCKCKCKCTRIYACRWPCICVLTSKLQKNHIRYHFFLFSALQVYLCVFLRMRSMYVHERLCGVQVCVYAPTVCLRDSTVQQTRVLSPVLHSSLLLPYVRTLMNADVFLHEDQTHMCMSPSVCVTEILHFFFFFFFSFPLYPLSFPLLFAYVCLNTFAIH
jgi:hypothetical protein